MKLNIETLPPLLQKRLRGDTFFQVVSLFHAVTSRSRLCFDKSGANLGIVEVDPAREKLDPFVACRMLGTQRNLEFCFQGDTAFALNDTFPSHNRVITLFPSNVMVVDVEVENEYILKPFKEAFEEGCVYYFTQGSGYVKDGQK